MPQLMVHESTLSMIDYERIIILILEVIVQVLAKVGNDTVVVHGRFGAFLVSRRESYSSYVSCFQDPHNVADVTQDTKLI